ncbi:MAG: cyclase family protein [Candidatus Atribacteria bacterium]|nr:cyclase family protein [Candidatus Atribacteria bacterium]
MPVPMNVSWIDLSLPVYAGSPVFPDQPSPTFFPWTTIDLHGNATNAFFMVEHTGTHLDVASHFVTGGEDVDKISVDHFCGRAVVLEVSGLSEKKEISAKEIENICNTGKIIIQEGDIVLFHTGDDSRYGKPEYFNAYPGLSSDAAWLLVSKRVKAVGIDAPSIDHVPYLTHRIFLSAGVIIYEFLTHLKQLLGQEVTFFGFPLKFVGCTGSPVRAVARIAGSSPE